MRIKLKAHELVDGEIDFVSLVKNGANRAPFKVVKSEDAADSNEGPTFKDRLRSVFGKKEVAPDPIPSVVEKEFSSIAESSSFSESVNSSAFFPSVHMASEALLESTFHALNKAGGIDEAIDQIDKNLAAFRKHVMGLVKNLPTSVLKMDAEGLFNDLASSTLEINSTDTVGNEDSEMTGERVPEAMAGDLEGLNTTIEKDEAALRVADAKAEAAVAAEEPKAEPVAEAEIEKASPGDPVVNQTSDTGEVNRDEGLPAGYRETQKMMKSFEDGKIVEREAKFLVNDETGDEIFLEYVTKEETPVEVAAEVPVAVVAEPAEVASAQVDLTGIAEPLNLIGKALNDQSGLLGEIKTGLEGLAKSTEEAIKKTESVTLVDSGYDLDESLATLNGHKPVSATVRKEEVREDVFKGLCPELEALEERFRNR